MRVLCDVHIPYALVSRHREIGVDATHVNRVLDGSETSDSAIAAFVDANDTLLITKDGDFRDSHFLTGTPTRLRRVTLGNLPNTELMTLVEAHWPIIAELAEQAPCYIELSRGGTIVRFPRN